MAAFVGREEALTVRIGRNVCFFVRTKVKYHLFSFYRHCHTSDNKIYKNNSNILVHAFNKLSGLLIIDNKITATFNTVSLGTRQGN